MHHNTKQDTLGLDILLEQYVINLSYTSTELLSFVSILCGYGVVGESYLFK